MTGKSSLEIFSLTVSRGVASLSRQLLQVAAVGHDAHQRLGGRPVSPLNKTHCICGPGMLSAQPSSGFVGGLVKAQSQNPKPWHSDSVQLRMRAPMGSQVVLRLLEEDRTLRVWLSGLCVIQAHVHMDSMVSHLTAGLGLCVHSPPDPSSASSLVNKALMPGSEQGFLLTWTKFNHQPPYLSLLKVNRQEG